ncbi:Integral membrane protein 2C [Varanus komodoensis]|uniref:Integral membrane protein 2 n=1 Tax=Varanus komodoensis TaxID=61221 RepID=A0A8D2L3F9_VARKO|nr:integral membrane protein 2C [Varanus komodoensis]KAF7243300.1 Integral membrane protein 2C [Varanus komodoensis]
MVKIGFQQPAAGFKPDKEADSLGPGNGAKAEILLPQDVEEQCFPSPVRSRRSLSHIFYLAMILMLLFLGLILTSMYIYRYFSFADSVTDSVTALDMLDLDYIEWECEIIFEDDFDLQLKEELKLHEDVRINLEEDYERINVSAPQFGESDPADIIHDFQRGLTAYHDLALDKCYVIELNTTIVLPPQNFSELLANLKKEAYLPHTYIIQEEMIVTEYVTDMDQLGSFIYRLCHGKETYRLKRRTARRHIHRRATEKCHHIRHFANTFAVDTAICQES